LAEEDEKQANYLPCTVEQYRQKEEELAREEMKRKQFEREYLCVPENDTPDILGSQQHRQLQKPLYRTRNVDRFNIDDLKRKRRSCQRELDLIDKVTKTIENMKYTVGEVVFHKEYGNGIIADISVEGGSTLFTAENVDCHSTGYKVRFSNHDLQFAEESELLPFNHAVEVLYGKKG
jgi:hypothetical protein